MPTPGRSDLSVPGTDGIQQNIEVHGSLLTNNGEVLRDAAISGALAYYRLFLLLMRLLTAG